MQAVPPAVVIQLLRSTHIRPAITKRKLGIALPDFVRIPRLSSFRFALTLIVTVFTIHAMRDFNGDSYYRQHAENGKEKERQTVDVPYPLSPRRNSSVENFAT